MKVLFKIGMLHLFFFLTSFSFRAHKCESKIVKKSVPCPNHLSTITTLNKPLASNSVKIAKAKVFEKHKYSIDEMDMNYYVCPACHM